MKDLLRERFDSSLWIYWTWSITCIQNYYRLAHIYEYVPFIFSSVCADSHNEIIFVELCSDNSYVLKIKTNLDRICIHIVYCTRDDSISYNGILHTFSSSRHMYQTHICVLSSPDFNLSDSRVVYSVLQGNQD